MDHRWPSLKQRYRTSRQEDPDPDPGLVLEEEARPSLRLKYRTSTFLEEGRPLLAVVLVGWRSLSPKYRTLTLEKAQEQEQEGSPCLNPKSRILLEEEARLLLVVVVGWDSLSLEFRTLVGKVEARVLALV